MLDNPGLYAIGVKGDPNMETSLVASKGGKLFGLVPDNELSPDRFHPDAFIQKVVIEGFVTCVANELEDTKLLRLKRGECLKCGMGPRRESCAYPEACEHPGRELALLLNQALIRISELEGQR